MLVIENKRFYSAFLNRDKITSYLNESVEKQVLTAILTVSYH